MTNCMHAYSDTMWDWLVTCNDGEFRGGGDRNIAVFDIDDVLSGRHGCVAERLNGERIIVTSYLDKLSLSKK